jgi:hypothetical protein
VFTMTALGPKEAKCELHDVICTLGSKHWRCLTQEEAGYGRLQQF